MYILVFAKNTFFNRDAIENEIKNNRETSFDYIELEPFI